jgi:single-strand DNA-binding protein
LNKLILIGNVGRDPELRYTPSGQAVTSFSVASNHRYRTSSGEQREETEWFSCQAWGKLADVCNQYLTKGQQVYIEGRLKSRTYQTQNGETRFSNDVMVSQFQFLGRLDNREPMPAGIDDDDNDLPF